LEPGSNSDRKLVVSLQIPELQRMDQDMTQERKFGFEKRSMSIWIFRMKMNILVGKH
jgi:hypothetical protein